MLPFLVAAAGLVLAGRRPRLGRRLAAAGLAALWLLSTPWVASRLARWAEAGQRPLDAAAWQRERDGPRPPRAVVVLGSGIQVAGPDGSRRGRPTWRSLERTVAGARVARDTGLPVLIAGGRTPWVDRSEAEAMRETMQRDLGVEVRWIEDRSRDTAENAALSAAILRGEGIDAIVLVTHAFHMARARASFEAAGLRVVPAPHDWLASAPAPFTPAYLLPQASAYEIAWLALHELVGRVWYGLRGHA